MFVITMPSDAVLSYVRTSYRKMSAVISGPVTFGLIPHDHWFQPEWIDEDRATAGREHLIKDGVIYGGKPCLSLPW